jgi:hypothetical protein
VAESRIAFSQHALNHMPSRGTTRDEVEEAVRSGERLAAKRGRHGYRKNFPYRAEWKGRYYETKQVMPIVVVEGEVTIIVTVYVFYFGGEG